MTGKHTDVMNFYSLFDSANSISCMEESLVPFRSEYARRITSFIYVGNGRIFERGCVKCEVAFRRRKVCYEFMIAPDGEEALPFLIGRHVLCKFNLYLC